MRNFTLSLCLVVGSLIGIFGQTSAQGLTEGFEGVTFPPAGWAVFDNSVGTNESWVRETNNPNNGVGHAYTDYECGLASNSEDWLVTPLVAITASDFLMSWNHFQPDASDYGSLYIIKVSTTSQTVDSTFVPVDTIFEADVPTSGYAGYTYDLSAYIGQSIYIAIVHEQSCGDDYYMDDFQIKGSCPPPAAPAMVGNITQSSADVTWMMGGGPVQVGVRSGTQTAPVPVGPATTVQPLPLSGLMAGTNYDVFIRSECPGTVPMVISGVFDGALSGGQPKGIELYVIDSIADLSDFGVSSTNNGSGTTSPNPEFVFPAGSASAGDYIYVTSDSTAFVTYYGFSPNYVSTAMLINGDDAIELYQDSAVVDVFGDVNTDGSGEPWDYLDGWAYRNTGVSANGGAFDTLNWTYSGINAIDGCTSDSTCSSSIPFGTFTTDGAVYSPWVGPTTFATLCDTNLIGDSPASPFVVTSVNFADTNNTDPCYTDFIGNTAPDAWYQVILDPCTDTIVASLCGSTFDTYIRLYDSNFNLIDDNDDDGPVCSGLTSSIATNVVGFDTVYVVAEGFGANAGLYFITIDQNVTPLPMPVLDYPMDSVCVGSPIMLPNPTMGMGMFSSNDSTLILNDSTGAVDPATVGVFDVTYTVGFPGCMGSDTTTLSVIDFDDSTIGYASDTICDSLGNPLPSNIATPGGMFSISSGGSIDASTGAIDLSTTPSNASYTVTYATNGLCPDTGSTTVYIIECLVGIEDDLGDRFALYPNPNNGRFFIANQGLDLNATVEVMDLVGKTISSKEINFLQGQRHTIELNGVTEGTYFVRIRSLEGVATYKVTVSGR